MEALTKVAQYLGYASEIRIKNLEVREWANVYWVHIKGQKPTLLSKKLVDRTSQIRVGYTIAGEFLIKDEKQGKCYIIRTPGYYGTGEYSIREIKEYQVSLGADFSDFRSEIHRAKYTQKPQNLRELMVFKAVRNAA
ncbi:MAG: hypothetical protein KME52_27885 [Desmonostoc geniculatum HA4340-LM1]|jgi:hypothetical protein|nr:hypothetical protein [Desmonostoc geniculatum HA4340-LM1]